MNKSFLKIIIILSSLIALPGILLAVENTAVNSQITDVEQKDAPEEQE